MSGSAFVPAGVMLVVVVTADRAGGLLVCFSGLDSVQQTRPEGQKTKRVTVTDAFSLNIITSRRRDLRVDRVPT